MVEYMKRAYTVAEIEEKMDSLGYLKGNIPFTLSELNNLDYDEFLDLASMRLVDSTCLINIETTPIGVENGKIIIEVSGDATMVVGTDDEDYDCEPDPYEFD